MFSSVLVASRGVGACRIAKTLKRLGIRVVAVHSEADRFAPHVLMADRALCIGRAPAVDSYLKAEAILDAARVAGVDAIHPGFGYLSENADFAEAVARLGLVFIGPLPAQIRALTNEASLRLLAAEVGVPRLRAATGLNRDRRRRIVEVQLFGNGDVVALGDRERLFDEHGRSVFDRAPASIDGDFCHLLRSAATSIGRAIRYQSAGTLAFACDLERREFFVSSAQPGLTAEHGSIEATTGIDLIEWMIQAAARVSFDLSVAVVPRACTAVSAYVFAVDPTRAHRPSAGIVTEVSVPDACRLDPGVDRGSELGEHCDPHVATIVAVGATPESAHDTLVSALKETSIGGIETNLDWLRSVAASSPFESGECASLTSVGFVSRTFEVLRPGTFSIVVDYPGRVGYWTVGIPPSGPMDDLSHRHANRAVGNAESAACLELTLSGPTLAFFADALVALCGAPMPAWLDDAPIDMNRPHRIRAGQTLRCGSIGTKGARSYLAIQGGIQIAPYLGSLTTFTLGRFGGHGGRSLQQGDVLHFGRADIAEPSVEPHTQPALELTNDWRIGVLYGPHAAPEFFTERDIEVLFSTDYAVHFNSNRTGVRLIGPKPEWARADGGEAGLHPSNIHDVAYAVGAVDFTGDMPIILGPDGPSLGGFVCPAAVATAELWKLGQLRPGDRVRFVPISESQAAELRKSQLAALAAASLAPPTPLVEVVPERAVIAKSEAGDERVSVTYRRAGDRYLLIEYGSMVLDLRLRFRVHALMTWLEECNLPGIIELTPGIRSLQIHFDEAAISQGRLLDALQRAELELPDTKNIDVPSRIVHLPLSWDDPQTRRAIAIYTQSVRPEAPWCPSNIEFIRRINGLGSEEDVYDTVFGATYLVLGLGDVYLGAPVATPIDPRHRLVTTKYNPARTWTPENAVGIGGAYLCIYGMEGPGGYQFVGRTLQVFNRYRKTRHFTPERPWLLRFFDQIRFYPVSAEQLMDQRRDFPYGKCDIDVEETRFSARTYRDFLAENQESIAHFKARQHKAFEDERERWVESGQLNGAETAKTKSKGAPPTKPASASAEARHD